MALRTMIQRVALAAAPVAVAPLGGPTASAVTIDTVLVGNPGAEADIAYSSAGRFGKVDYLYRMGTYEVTNAQYAEFLNAVAAEDFNGLYQPLMDSNPRGGIARHGSPGGYSYTVKENMAGKPVLGANLWDAARFVNWLHNGQPSGGQGDGTTEDGAYDLNGFAPVNGVTWSREPDAVWFLPNENEWYKAAYHDPRGTAEGGPPGDDHYWRYPTRSDAAPTAATATATGEVANPGDNVINFDSAPGGWNGVDANVVTVGSAGPGSASYWGTYDQGGNAFELLEDPLPPLHYVTRGGSYGNDKNWASATSRTGSYPEVDQMGLGFRVARIALPDDAIAGDYNGDGSVDVDDYNLWRSAYGEVVSPGAGADGNGDGVIDPADYTVWRDHAVTSAVTSTASRSVPEPCAMALAALSAAASLLPAPRRRHSL